MKKYKRLTERAGNGKAVTKGCKTCPDYCFDCSYADSCIDRLAELEDKIEQGKLVELPYMCEEKLGKDTYYHIFFWDNEYNSINFYTIKNNKEQAEARLKELQNE